MTKEIVICVWQFECNKDRIAIINSHKHSTQPHTSFSLSFSKRANDDNDETLPTFFIFLFTKISFVGSLLA